MRCISTESLWKNPPTGLPLSVSSRVAGLPVSGHVELATLPNIGTPAPNDESSAALERALKRLFGQSRKLVGKLSENKPLEQAAAQLFTS